MTDVIKHTGGPIVIVKESRQINGKHRNKTDKLGRAKYFQRFPFWKNHAESGAISGLCGREKAGGFLCREVRGAVKEVKKNREWRREYMTLLMRDEVNQKKVESAERI